MSTEEAQDKIIQFDEFFSIEHTFSINVKPIDAADNKSYEQFVACIPLPFKMASDVVSLDQAALRPLQAISGVAGQLVEFLNHQAHKIDLLVGYILSQQDNEDQRYQGVKFGGGGIILATEEAFELGQLLELKIFFIEDNCAVFCHGEVIEITPQDADSNKTDSATNIHYKIVFHHIREEDREILVRTSLHQQSKQLQSLAKKRNNEAKNS